MKIIIIGAGIAGCVAYLELRKHLPKPSQEPDHEIIMFESYATGMNDTAESREGGSTHSSTLLVGGGLGIAPNGLGVLQRLDEDLLRDVARGGYVTSHSNLRQKNGRLLMRIEPNGPISKNDNGPATGMHTVAISRHSFWRCLRARIPDEHIINKRVLEVVANSEGRNTVRFVDGSDPVEADLIIGADGVRSIAKRALFPDDKEDLYPSRYEGLVGVGGFVPAADVKDKVEEGSMNFVFGGNGFFGYFFSDSASSAPHRDSPYHVSKPGDSLAWWSTYAIKECPDRKMLDMDDVVQQLRERHAHWEDPVIQKVMQSMTIRNMYPTWTVPPLPTWERDGVVLLGDAAHALPSTSGQGCSQALEDCESFALFLAHYLGKEAQENGTTTMKSIKMVINAGAKQYVALRQPRVKEILETAQRMQNTKRDMGVIQEYAMYTFMKILGFFPNLAAGPMKKVGEYNVADQVAQLLASEK